MKNFRTPLWISLSIFFLTCQKEDVLHQNDPIPNAESVITTEPEFPPGDLMVLGPPLENPYSLENMKKALKSLRKSSRAELPGDYEVKTTHYYVKFLPENEAHLSLLSLDEGLILYDYPLDRKIKKLGNYYTDPNAPKDKPMPLYASVEVDDELPQSVPYEILSHLHLPNDYGDYEFIESNQRRLSNFIESLVDESLRLTGNWEDVVTPSENARSRKWTPSGTVKTYDSSEGSNIPVEGLKVRARRWFTTHTGMTNSSGYYRCDGSFRRPANYSLKFERHDFQIRTSTWLFNSAGVNGPKIERSWNPIFLSTKPESYYATIFRAAHHYYYQYVYGLHRPPQNSIWKTQLKLKAFFKRPAGSFGADGSFSGFPLRGFGLYSPVQIYDSSRPSEDIYATTIHELAHAAHWCQGWFVFNNSEVKVKESWARGVEWFLTKTVYDGYVPSYSIGSSTGVVQDMIDTIKDEPLSTINESVSGYTISQIEKAMIGKKKWSGWRDNIKAKYNNSTENHLDALFDSWNL